MSKSAASEAANSYAALTPEESSAIIDKSLQEILKLDEGRFGLVTDDFHGLVSELHVIGRYEQYLELSFDQRISILQAIGTDSKVPVETFFLLDDLMPGVRFTHVSIGKDQQFSLFNKSLDRAFIGQFKNDENFEFRKSLHRYFEAFGYSNEKDSSGYLWPCPGVSDPYLALAAFLLRTVCDENRVTELLNHIVNENYSIRAIDFINIVESDVDFTLYPVQWTVSLVSQSSAAAEV